MNKQEILLQLFMRESPDSVLLPLGDLDQSILENENFIDWSKLKRGLVNHDVENSHWIKTCTGGYITEVIFHADGTLNEYRLFDRYQTVGAWSIFDGILHIKITKGENTYTLNVVGNSSVNIHSAIEYKNSKLHAYLKLAQVK